MRGLSAAASVAITGLPRGGITAEFERFLSETPAAGILLFRRDFGIIGRLPELVQRLRGLAAPHSLLVCMDEEGGLVSQLAPDLPVPPAARVLGRASDETEVASLGAYTGRCLRALGVDVDFAPVLDVDSEPVNPVIGPRAFSADVDAVCRLGLANARGLLSGGVIPCAKHFPGHGDTRLDSHLVLPRCPAPRELLAERDLAPFRAVVAAQIPLVMVSHVHYPAIDPEETPATLSPAVVTGLLRGELGYRGAVVTDAMEMHAVALRYAPERAARLALEAGCDLLLYGAFTPELQAALAHIAASLEAGDEALTRRVKEARARIETLRGRCGTGRPEIPAAPPVDLVALCRRALRWVGGPPRPSAPPAGAGPRWLVVEPRWAAGPSLAELLREVGWQVSSRPWEEVGGTGQAEADLAGSDRVLAALARRTPPTAAEAARLGEFVAARPSWVGALGQDAFLADLPGAAGRLSACDPGEPMRRAVAAALAEAAAGV
jgi:beta-glucosidase-like glycosyl hydrolase